MNPIAPQDRFFYKGWGHLLGFAGLGSDQWYWYHFPKRLYYLFKLQAFCTNFICPMTISSQLIFLYFSYYDITLRTRHNVYSVIPIGLIVNSKMVSSRRECYRKLMKDFMDKIHLYNYYKKNNTEFVRKKCIQIDNASICIGFGLLIFFYSTWLTWMITPFIMNSRNMEAVLNRTENFLTCTYLWMPFEYIYDYNKWFIANTCNVYVTFLAIVIIVGFDAANYIIILHLIGHIQILKDNVRNCFIEDEKLSDNEAKTKLMGLIHDHCFILQVFEDIKGAFGFNLAANYMQNLVEDGLLMYQLMLGDKESFFTYGLTLCMSIGGLILMSLVIEEIQRTSDDLPEILYSYVPWEDMSLSNRKTYAIMLAKIQPRMEFRALGGGFKAGVIPAFNILKTTFSYYLMIKTSVQIRQQQELEMLGS